MAIDYIRALYMPLLLAKNILHKEMVGGISDHNLTILQAKKETHLMLSEKYLAIVVLSETKLADKSEFTGRNVSVSPTTEGDQILLNQWAICIKPIIHYLDDKVHLPYST